jgi:hypothetical protein
VAKGNEWNELAAAQLRFGALQVLSVEEQSRRKLRQKRIDRRTCHVRSLAAYPLIVHVRSDLLTHLANVTDLRCDLEDLVCYGRKLPTKLRFLRSILHKGSLPLSLHNSSVGSLSSLNSAFQFCLNVRPQT